MRRRKSHGLLMLIAVGIVGWFILSRTFFYVRVPFGVALVLIGLGIVGIYLLLRWIF